MPALVGAAACVGADSTNDNTAIATIETRLFIVFSPELYERGIQS
jgi:hypothetical protein